MKDYLRSLVLVILELAAFAAGVVVLLLFVQKVGQELGSILLVMVLMVVIAVLAALRNGK